MKRREYCTVDILEDEVRMTVQLVVAKELREKVVSLAHDTLLAGHRGPAKTEQSTARVLLAWNP